jgi:hypothetical protein
MGRGALAWASLYSHIFHDLPLLAINSPPYVVFGAGDPGRASVHVSHAMAGLQGLEREEMPEVDDGATEGGATSFCTGCI